MKVKLFYGYRNNELEEEINNFLNYKKVDIKHVVQSESYDLKKESRFITITIFYEQERE
jgi:hypothetical protein